MKILFCSPVEPTKKLGVSKIILELAEELTLLDWACKIISPADILQAYDEKSRSGYSYSQGLHRYLQRHAHEYDVVEYDHSHLPYPRNEFADKTLFVARSALLTHHFEKITIPITRRLRSRVRALMMSGLDKIQQRKKTLSANTTCVEADLINVANEDDKSELLQWGIPKDKIIVLPYGISRSRRPLFDAVPSEVPPIPKVAFIGTFDNRKGCTDFPEIVGYINKKIPNTVFRLLGTAGLYKTKKEVLSFFPRQLRPKLEIVPYFTPDELPELLTLCSIGIFPSYVEGFGFGVLEMLAASVPAIAYDSPGPTMMLCQDYLVPRRDRLAMAIKVIDLLKDKKALAKARIWAKERSKAFSWQEIAKRTSEIYLEACRKKTKGCL